uniref:hypothetical protein n=1 Tax=Curtobacterium flaccumfaciens TaxID=2035 RepID=UPI0036F2A631
MSGRCATTATWNSSPATASSTSTSRGHGVRGDGQGAKRIAEIAFDSAGRKKLLIKIAPIEKL